MPKNVMKLLKPSPHRTRNDFDLSHRHVLDANFGELLPVTTIETVPGDNVTLHASDLLRTIPFVSSPFLRAKQHLDVWFVPYRDLWHNFDSFITQKTEPVSSALRSHFYVPHTSLTNIKTAITQRDTAGDTDVVGRGLGERSFYLAQLLGYGAVNTLNTAWNVKVNLWNIAAYNYIWYNEYRQQYYDDGTRLLDSNENASYLFSFDDLSCGTDVNADINSDSYWQKRLAAMFQLRYRCWKKDLFTGILPSTQFGNVSVVNEGLIQFASPSNIVDTIDSANIRKYSATDPRALFKQSSQSYTSALKAPDISVLDLRKSEAIQIWRENALRAGNHIKDNMLAHYGVASDFQDHRPTYLGSVSAPLNIGDIAATANSSSGINNTVGDIAGKGLSSLSEKVFKYHAKEFGVIMVMFSILPEAEYDANGIERNNQLLEAEDYFVPEYENLGLEGVSSLNFGLNNFGGQPFVVGYAPRYFGYKQKLDRVFGQFVGSTGLFRTWTSQRADVTAAFSSGSNPANNLEFFYVNPAIYNFNFNVAVNVSPQFLCDIYFDVDAVRPMSVTGLPFS